LTKSESLINSGQNGRTPLDSAGKEVGCLLKRWQVVSFTNGFTCPLLGGSWFILALSFTSNGGSALLGLVNGGGGQRLINVKIPSR
jgi:hypothetical protein